MKKHPYLHSFWLLMGGAVSLSVMLVVLALTKTLSAETGEVVQARNLQLKDIKKKKESFFEDIKNKEVIFKNYKEQWAKALNGLRTQLQVKNRLNRLAAESNLMLREKAWVGATLELEVTGEYISLIEWLNKLEAEFFTVKIVEAHLQSDRSNPVTATLTLQYFKALES